jgi:protein-tyrosine phosphatase
VGLLPPFIDLHCHLLPDVDDGPKTLKDSLLLARSLADKGFSHVVATPHYIEDYSPDYRQRVEQSFRKLTHTLREEKVPLTVYLGGELLVTPALIALAKERELPTLNGTRYVLVELPLYQPLPLYMEDVFFALQARGYTPVLAHPERMEAFKGDIQKVYKLASRGICMQINLGSLVGVFGRSAKRLAIEMLKYHLAPFVASDSHDSALVDMVAAELSNPSFSPDLLQGNPRRALQDESVALEPQKPPHSIQAKTRKILKF